MRQEDRAIVRFEGAFRFLSNFYPAIVSRDGRAYPAVEHAFQAAKVDGAAKDAERWRNWIQNAPTAAYAKRLGRRCPKRPDWEDVKQGVMLALLREKFARSGNLAAKLLATGSMALVEGNNRHDTYWGVCDGYCYSAHAHPIGTNYLGLLLAQVRGALSSSTLA